MSPAAPAAPADRFAGIIDGLCRVVAAQIAGGRLAGPLIVLIWSRLRRIARRFAAIAARLQAGKPPRRAASGPRRARPKRPCPPRPLPQGFAWLVRLVPDAAAYGSQLQHLLAEPDMAALLAAAPQTGRLLRPLCRMLAIRPPPGLKPARPTRPPPPDPPDPQAAAAAPRRTPPPARTAPPPPLPPLVHPGACGPPVRA